MRVFERMRGRGGFEDDGLRLELKCSIQGLDENWRFE